MQEENFPFYELIGVQYFDIEPFIILILKKPSANSCIYIPVDIFYSNGMEDYLAEEDKMILKTLEETHRIE